MTDIRGTGVLIGPPFILHRVLTGAHVAHLQASGYSRLAVRLKKIGLGGSHAAQSVTFAREKKRLLGGAASC
jgi:hypothetical protein